MPVIEVRSGFLRSWGCSQLATWMTWKTRRFSWDYDEIFTVINTTRLENTEIFMGLWWDNSDYSLKLEAFGSWVLLSGIRRLAIEHHHFWCVTQRAKELSIAILKSQGVTWEFFKLRQAIKNWVAFWIVGGWCLFFTISDGRITRSKYWIIEPYFFGRCSLCWTLPA